MWHWQAQVVAAERYEVIPGATRLRFIDGSWLIFPPIEYTWQPGDWLRMVQFSDSGVDMQINRSPVFSLSYKDLWRLNPNLSLTHRMGEGVHLDNF